MAIPTRGRQLIGGVWQNVTFDESPSGGGLPAGGSTGEVLTKESNADGDAGWEPGGGSQPITRAQYDLALIGVAQGTPTKLPFVFNYGTQLLDLSDTTDPTPVESGTYSFAVTVTISGVTSAGWSVVVTLDEDDFAATLTAFEQVVGTAASQAVTFPFYVPAGSPCHVQVTHDSNDVGGADFTGHVYVQRLS